jgi:SAM-dependent methyltransferase
MIGERLRDVTPKWAKTLVPQAVKDKILGTTHIDTRQLPSLDYIRGLMCHYQVNDLVKVDPKSFRARIDEFLHLEDGRMEGFREGSLQRDLSIKFHWGHDHDFGDFSVKGRLGERHLTLIAMLIDWFPALPKSLEGMRVLDIGCWTGGTSLVLCAMGAHVVAVEEVKKYIDCLNYLKFAFDLDRLEPRNLSLYECTTADLQDSFDFVLFAGVLYHVTDPVLALRIAYNCLKDDGTCVIETAVTPSRQNILSYEGPGIFHSGRAEDLNRGGWNWFSPSPTTLHQMMNDVGFTNVRLSPMIQARAGKRMLAWGQRRQHKDMLRSGLSVRSIR